MNVHTNVHINFVINVHMNVLIKVHMNVDLNVHMYMKKNTSSKASYDCCSAWSKLKLRLWTKGEH